MRILKNSKTPQFTDSELSIFSGLSLVDDQTLENVRIVNLQLTGIIASDVGIESSLLSGLEISAAKLDRLKLVDVRLEKTNGANSSFKATYFNRVVITGCRLTGAQLSEGSFRNVVFSNCKLDLVTFRFAKLIDVQFEDCILIDADFQGAELERVSFDRCDLQSVQFSQAKIKNLDLSGSRIEGIKIAPDQLKGVTIDYSQIIDIVKLLGVTII